MKPSEPSLSERDFVLRGHAVSGLPSSPKPARPISFAGQILQPLRLLLTTIFSFEALFALFLYSNTLKYFFPPLPIDETVILLSLSALAAVLLVWSTGIPHRSLPLLAAATLFFGWLTFSMIWSPGRTLALRGVAYNLTFNTFCLFVAATILAADRRRIHRFFACVLIIGIVLSIHGLWIYSQYGTFRFYHGFRGISAYLLWGFPVATASAISLALAFAAPVGTARHLLGVVTSVLFGSFLLVASARGAMLSYAVCLLIPVILVLPRVARNRLLISRIQVMALLGLIAFLCYMVYAVSAGDVPYTVKRFFDLFGYIEYGGTAVRFERLSYWASAIDFWSRAPLFGHGIGSFSSLYLGGREIAGTQPHNIILEILVDLGFVGAVLFASMLWIALRPIRIAELASDPTMLSVVLMFATKFGVRAMTSDELAFQWELFVSLGLLTAAVPRAQAPYRA